MKKSCFRLIIVSILFVLGLAFIADDSYAQISRGSVRTRNIYGVRRIGISGRIYSAPTRRRLPRRPFGNIKAKKTTIKKSKDFLTTDADYGQEKESSCYGEAVTMCRKYGI